MVQQLRSGVEGSKLFINAGVGYGLLPYSIAIPPIHASVEYGLKKIPLSIGAVVDFTTYKEDYGFGSEYSGTMVGLGLKGAYHFNFAKNFDPYIGLTLGYLLWNEEHKYTLWDQDYKSNSNFSTFYYGFNLGARYFFTKSFGVYLELGYSAITVANAGITLKF